MVTEEVSETSPHTGGLAGKSSTQDREVDFAHPSEGEFARILEFYGVRWRYEPWSFLLGTEGDRITEMFTPDFYVDRQR